MADPQAFTYKLKDLAEIMVKDQKLHEGFWGVYFEFALSAGMIQNPQGGDQNITPAAIVPVINVGIHRFEKPNSLTVDAAEVNPLEAIINIEKKKVQSKKHMIER